MNERLLNAIKNERRLNLGKRFNRWIDYQWDYEKGSFNKWRVSEERAVREIAESILSDPSKCYFVYKDNSGKIRVLCEESDYYFEIGKEITTDLAEIVNNFRPVDFILRVLLIKFNYN